MMFRSSEMKYKQFIYLVFRRSIMNSPTIQNNGITFTAHTHTPTGNLYEILSLSSSGRNWCVCEGVRLCALLMIVMMNGIVGNLLENNGICRKFVV